MWRPPRSADGYLVGIVWRRPVPTFADKRPSLSEKWRISTPRWPADADNPVFYEDEVDIDLNPKLGADWMFRAQQKRVVTPGQNASIIWQAFSTQATEGYFTSAGSRKLIAVYCHAGKAAPPLPTSQNHHVDLDNYIIHKSKQTERWLKKNPKFCLVFQPVYSPWVNHIERLWHKLHETIAQSSMQRDGKPAGPSETLHGYRVSFPGEWLWHSEGVALLGSVI